MALLRHCLFELRARLEAGERLDDLLEALRRAGTSDAIDGLQPLRPPAADTRRRGALRGLHGIESRSKIEQPALS